MDMTELGEALVANRDGASGAGASGVGASGAGVLPAGSCCGALAWPGGWSSEVDATDADSAAATTAAAADTAAPFPPAMAYFIRAASCSTGDKEEGHDLPSSVQHQSTSRVDNGELTWSSHAFFSFSCASLLFFSSSS